MNDCVEISVLGPIEIVGQGGRVAVVGTRVRRFLGLLVVEAGRAVSFDRLVDVVWTSGRRPGSSAVHSMATRVRSLVGPDCIRLEDHSYVLDVPSDNIDADRFEREVLEAVGTLGEDPAAAMLASDHALRLWRGEPYGDLASDDPFRLEAIRLTELRNAACETVSAGALAAGMHERAVLAAQQLTSELPYRDRSWELLVKALWEDGRRVEALEAIRRCADLMTAAGLELPDSLASFGRKHGHAG
jgi:DNA-binding SARP family transcriptional activator